MGGFSIDWTNMPRNNGQDSEIESPSRNLDGNHGVGDEVDEPKISLRIAVKRIAQCLQVSAFLVALSSLNTFLFSLFSFNGSRSSWLLGMSTSALSVATPLLISFLLIACAAGFDPRNKVITSRLRFIAKASWWISLLLIVLIPIQIFSGIKALQARTQSILGEVIDLKNIIKGIRSTGNEVELRAFMASLPNPPKLPARFDAPFSVIKGNAILNLEGTVNRALNDMETQKRNNLQVLIVEGARNSIQSLLLSAGFAMVAGLRSQKYGIGKIILGLLNL